jgi:hypothetical protein
VCLQLNLSKRAISYYLKQLKASGSIRKVGYGVWEATEKIPEQVTKIKVCSLNKFDNFVTSLPIRGHAFVFHLRIPKINGWKKRTIFLEKKGIHFKQIKEHTQRIIFRGHKMWLSDKSITVYCPKGKSYFGNSARETEDYSIFEFKQLVQGIESLFNVSFLINKRYVFRVSRHHFSRVRDALAVQCDSEKQKINIKLENGWFHIDNSYQLHEAETEGKKAKFYMDERYACFIRDLMEMKEKFLPSQAIDMIGKVTANQLVFAENQRSHIKAVQDLSKGVEKFNEQIGLLVEFLKNGGQNGTKKS